MKKLNSKLAAKLKNSRGESMAEVLIALLIAALALTMLASVISTSSRIITQTKEKMKLYYEENDKLSVQGASSNTMELTITVSSSTYTTVSEGEEVHLQTQHPSADKSAYNTHLNYGASEETVLYYVNDKLGGTKVISFRKN